MEERIVGTLVETQMCLTLFLLVQTSEFLNQTQTKRMEAAPVSLKLRIFVDISAAPPTGRYILMSVIRPTGSVWSSDVTARGSDDSGEVCRDDAKTQNTPHASTYAHKHTHMVYK